MPYSACSVRSLRCENQGVLMVAEETENEFRGFGPFVYQMDRLSVNWIRMEDMYR